MEKWEAGEAGDHDAVSGASACTGEGGAGEVGAGEGGAGEIAGKRVWPGSGGALDW